MIKQIDLGVATHPDWVQVILSNFDEFMADHADCERKASAMAMKLVAKCADRAKILPPLIDLAIEELTHFREVYALMRKRGLELPSGFIDDPYVNQLLQFLRHGNDQRFLDHLLVLGVVETRGAERFKIVADALTDPELKDFYKRLYAAETKHGCIFLKFAQEYFDEKTILDRLAFFVAEEAKIIQGLKWRPSLH